MAVAKSELETRRLLKSPDFAEQRVDRFATEPVPPVLQRIIGNVEGEFLTCQQWKVKHVWARHVGRGEEHTQTVEQLLQEGVRINSASMLTLCFKLQTQVPRTVPKIGSIEGAFTINEERTGEVNVRKILKPGVRPLNSYTRTWTVPAPEEFASYPRIEEVEDKNLIPTDLFILGQNPKISLDPIHVSDDAKPETNNTVYIELKLMSLYAHYKLQEEKYRSKAERAKMHMAQ